ncbi:hypothetical protein, partial [Streptomyces sp. NPDC003522]
KGVFGVAGNFTRLATSIATDNTGDSIQRPAPTGEARPRLPQSTVQQSEGAQNEVPLPARPLPQGVRDGRPRFVVRSGFDARRFTHAGDPVTDLTVRVALRGTEGQKAHVREQLDLGVEEFLNVAGHRLPNGDRLHVTVEFVDPSDSPHLTVDLVGRDRAMDQVSWWVDAAPVQLVHELTHQLGLRDEYRDADAPHRPHVLGSLLGDLDAAPEDSSLAPAGLRDRHLALLGVLIGDVTPAPEEAGLSFAEARSAAVVDTREAVWVDPVSLPRSAEDTTGSDVPARMPQDSDGLSAPRSFRLGNFEFTNLNQTDRYVEKAMRIVELLDEHATIRDYVGGRPVRITLRLRTTEAPADVIDRGDDGVDINLASYYFEKYDTGYVMGMLAHEIGLHPLASRNGRIAEEEDLFAGMPLTVPGLESLSEPRFMNTIGSGQADHVMAAFPQSIRHALYRDVVVEMAGVLEQRARVGVEGAKAKDVTDLFDTYLMDLASIAVTNDHRARAITDPSYTARSYNAYKAQLDAHLPADSRLRALLPADKGRWGVLGDFAQLATSVGTNNRGDSIQRPAPTDEARPRLPQETDNGHRTGEEPGRRTLPGVPAPHGTRDGRPRFVVRSGFDARRFTHAGDPVTDLTVRVAFRGTGEQGARVRERLDAGVIQFLNDPGYRLPSGDRLHVTVEYVDPADSPHLTVDLVGRDRAMDQNTWWVDAAPVQLVHELTHQLGLRDEYRDADSPHRPHVLGSLLGDLEADPEDSSLAAAGLRGRHLALLGALIGDVSPAPEEAGRSFAEARSAAVADTREAVWVDPVSLPQPADDEVTGAGVPARMVRGEGLLPFGSGNFTFTNLNYGHDAYRNKAIRVIEALRGHAVIGEYVGGRPVRIMLHVRTTETPADVIDLDAARQRAAVQALQDAADSGDAQAAQVAQAELLDAVAERPAAEMRGVEINLASYYFEKYDTGYLMGMLAHEIGLHPLATAREELAQDEKDNRGVDQRVPGLPANRVMNTLKAGQADHVMAASPERKRHEIYRDVVVEMARVLAQQAADGQEGAVEQDVTDLFDTYLMDVATIAVTNDHRARAVLEPVNTAKVYNAYKELLRAQLADAPALQALLPPDKGWRGVAANFTRLATSIAANNVGDSIQRPAPAYEARPRLPRTGPAPASQGSSAPGSRTNGHRDSRPRFVVRSGFDVRRFAHDGDPVTDLTVRVALRGTEDRSAHVAEQLASGVEEFLNAAGHRLPNGDRLHVTVEFVDAADSPHLTVDLVGRDRAMDQNTWWVDAAPVQLVHELTHQLGLRDEYRDADAPHRPHVLGSLLGDLDVDPEDSSLATAGLRDRHLALLGALIGDVTPAPRQDTEEAGLSFAEARSAAVPDTREAVWVDPVSLPRPADDDATVTDVPARMPQDTDAVPAVPEPALRSFRMGNFEFTNLNQTDRYVDRAIRIVELLDEHATIRDYVGGRPVRITLRLRTTEAPADVIDRGDDGVDINLASYYFEKYDTGYLMGMLAHEIALHPLASRNRLIAEEEDLFAGMPLTVPGLESLREPRFMNTEGSGQADHVMAAFPQSIRHGIYRDVIVEMAGVLEQRARVGVEGAKAKDVTDLFDTYLMDLASIAVTNDHRARAITDPSYTARVYNAYKAQLDAHLPQDSRLRALLPADKGRWGVLGDFAQLATSVGTNNRGDSIQRPAPTDEARPRLPRGRQTQEGAEPDGQVLTTGPLSAGTRDGRPRFVVRSGFDARRFTHDGDPVTDLTVRVAMRGADGRSAHVFGRLSSGVEEFLNDPGYRLPSGDRLHVTVELVDVGESPHLTVDLVGRDEAMDQNTWWVDAAPVQLVHELTHQLGLRDEYRDADSPHRPHILGSLLGDLDADPEDSSLVAAGLRDRHLALLGALIGDVAPAPEEAGLSFAEARGAAVPDTREAVWVDPVSLPQPADGDTGVGVPARMTRGEGLRPFGSGNFTFTNLNYENDAYLGKAVRVIQTLSSHAVIGEYVAGRPVRITLHVRTTETPADVIDLDVARQDAAMRALEAAADSGDAEAAEAARAELADALVVRPAAEMRGVEINLASYYFEKYDTGYIMGMLAHEIGLHPLASARDGLGRDEADNRGVDQRV